MSAKPESAPPKKKRGLRLAIVGLTVGVIFGFGIIYLKKRIATELVALLADEVRGACDCEFKVDDISIRLLGLTAVGRNARVMSGGEPKLFFDKIRADFSLKEIRQRKVRLELLELIDGYSVGALQDSETFQVVDFLSTPTPPEKDGPDRFKIKLMQLSVQNSRFTESIGNTTLVADGVRLFLMRDDKDNFLLRPFIENLHLQIPDEPQDLDLPLGVASSKIYLEEGLARFTDLRLAFNDSVMIIDTDSDLQNDDALDGTMNFSVDHDFLKLPDFTDLHLEGSGTVKGTLDSPAFKGKFSSRTDEPSHIGWESLPLFDLDAIGGDFSFQLKDSISTLSISDMWANGPTARVKLQKPLTLIDDILSSDFEISVANLDIGGLLLEDVNARVASSGPLRDLAINVTGTAAKGKTPLYELPNLDYALSLRGETLQVSINHSSDQNGGLSIVGSSQVYQTPATVDLKYKVDNFSLTPIDTAAQDVPLKLRLGGDGTIKGPLTLEDVQMSGSLKASSRHFEGEAALRTNVKMRKGTLNISAFNQSGSLSAEGNLNLKKEGSGTINILLKDFKAKEYNPDLNCIESSLTASYSFPLASPASGKGELNLSKLHIGCDAESLKLDGPTTLPIHSGLLKAQQVTLLGPQSSLTVDGSIHPSGEVDLDVIGDVNLNALLPFFPTLDDLRGHVSTKLHVRGRSMNPTIEGTAKIENGELAAESADLDVEEVNGSISVSTDKIQIDDLRGSLNGGHVFTKGTIYPLRLADSSLEILLENLNLSLSKDDSLAFSGKVQLQTGEQGLPLLRGHIEIDRAEVRREFDVFTLLRALPEYVFRQKSTDQAGTEQLPEIEIDLDITATRNIFILTTWLGAEMMGSAHLGGSLISPTVTGKLETINGWFGLKERRFEITSGIVEFDPQTKFPLLDVVSETLVRTHTGETVLVILEATGPLHSPRVTLSSDLGLTQEEILSLVSSSVILTPRTLTDSRGDEIELDRTRRESDRDPEIMKIFRDLTRIDDISIEPTVNPQRGVVGPAIVAKKQIFDRLTAVGQTFLSEGADGARALLQYDLTPTLTAVGSADSSVTEEATALGADLVYTVLSSQNTYLEFTMTGNSEVSKEEILKELRINSSSRIPFEDLNNVASAIESLYRERGYLDATVQISCQVSLGMCKEISAEILEGRLYRISSMAISGADLSSIVDVKKYTESFIDSTASKDQLLQARSQLIALLRNEGYIGARSSLTQTKDPSNPGALQLSIRVQPGRPVSFTFKGHSHFSESDFFKTIRLFTRTQPFGRNTIKILVENIERLYREAGYLFATIRYEEYIDELDGRQHYIVTIDEEQRVQVESVQFEGNVLLPTSRLKARVADLYSPDILTQLLTPDRVINEDIERNIGFIAQVYLDEGLQGTEIHYRIEQGSSSGLLKIVYIISEGQLVQVPWIALEGLPTGIVLPELSKQNHTVPALNKHLDLARTKLRDQGFFSAQYWSEYDAEADQIVFHFEPNEQTLISGIDIAGNANITTSEILKTLELQIGDPWNLQKIREAKVSLLRLGLFSRVNIGPADGTLDSTREGLFIEVVEKPLQTLRVGGGANSELGLHIFGDAVDKSLFKDGRSLSFLFDTYYDERKADISTGTASLRYIDPDFANRAVLFTEEVRFQRIDLSTFEFDLDRTSLSTLLFRRHNPRLTYSLGHTIFHEELDDVSPDAIISPLDSGQVDLSFLTANLNYDRRDNPLNPGLGYRVGFTSSLSSEGLASDANFAKAGIRGSMLLPFQLSQLPFSLALNGRTESGWTFYDTSAIPISQRFYLGGRTTVRGFRENSLGPKGSNGSVIGGDLLVQSNLELRHPIGENFSAHLFFDAGTTYLRDIGISSSDLRESTGFGFRYRSPIGPIGIDVGFPLDERPGEPSTRLHFSIGSIF